MYFAITTRPNNSSGVNMLSQFNHCCNSHHWSTAKRGLRWVCPDASTYHCTKPHHTHSPDFPIRSPSDQVTDWVKRNNTRTATCYSFLLSRKLCIRETEWKIRTMLVVECDAVVCGGIWADLYLKDSPHMRLVYRADDSGVLMDTQMKTEETALWTENRTPDSPYQEQLFHRVSANKEMWLSHLRKQGTPPWQKLPKKLPI